MSTIAFSSGFAHRLNEESRRLGVSPQARLVALLTERLAPETPVESGETDTYALPEAFYEHLARAAAEQGISVAEYVERELAYAVAPAENLQPGFLEAGLRELKAFLKRIPCVRGCATSGPDEPRWWVKFAIDLDSPVAWPVIQYLGFVLNYLSLDERLPTAFKPVSPPPYLNGGPREYLSWMIEATLPLLDAGYIARVLEERLPQPVDDPAAWLRPDWDEDDEPEAEGSPDEPDTG